MTDHLFGILLGESSLINLSRHIFLLFFSIWLVHFFFSLWHMFLFFWYVLLLFWYMLIFFWHGLLFLLFFGLLTAVVLMTVVLVAVVFLTVVVNELDSTLALEFDRLERDLLDDHTFLALLV